MYEVIINNVFKKSVYNFFIFIFMFISIDAALAQDKSIKINLKKYLDLGTVKDAPITICSDRLNCTQKKHQLNYQENLVLFEVKGINV